MFTRILVPLDGSSLAEDALHIATRLARTLAGAVLAVHVVAPPTRLWPSSAPLLPSAAAQTIGEAQRIEATIYLEQCLRASHATGQEMSGEVHSGPPAATILSLAAARSTDLIVMSRHGKTGVSRWGLGSVAEKVARFATVPVLILPEGAGITGHEQVWHALVPLDGSRMAETALAPASCLVSALSPPGKATLNLFLVATLPVSSGRKEPCDEGMHSSMRQETACYLRAVQERFLLERQAEHRVALTSTLSVGLDVAETILTIPAQAPAAEAARDPGTQRVNLIAMTTCGQGEGDPCWMMGHVASRILSATHLPLLLVPHLRDRRAEHAPV